jgi:hypothetical protein
VTPKERKKKLEYITNLEKELWIPSSRYSQDTLKSFDDVYLDRLLNMLIHLKGEGSL